VNSFASPDRVILREVPLAAGSVLELPPLSASTITLKLPS
jgi:hypothetical protein